MSKKSSKSSDKGFSFEDRKNIVEIIGTALLAVDLEIEELQRATGSMLAGLEDLLDSVDNEKAFILHARLNKRLGTLQTLRLAMTGYLLEVYGDGVTEEEEDAAQEALSRLENTVVTTEDEDGNREVISGSKKIDKQ